jgi:hypothetical protein
VTLILLILFVLFMALWGLGGWYYFDRANPGMHGTTVLAWLSVLILGLIVFGAVDSPRKDAVVVVPGR